MNTLLQNPAILLVLVVFVARFVAKRFAAGKKNAAGPLPSADEAQRTQRVREEVARKIAERRGEGRPPVVARPRAAAPPPPPPPAPTFADADLAAVLADQQRMVDQMRVLEGVQAPSRSGSSGVLPAGVPAGGGIASLLPELNGPSGARRAMVLREVLGAPRGLTIEGCLWR